jgi:hypothetical protein
MENHKKINCPDYGKEIIQFYIIKASIMVKKTIRNYMDTSFTHLIFKSIIKFMKLILGHINLMWI